jgi:hypothetical protein
LALDETLPTSKLPRTGVSLVKDPPSTDVPLRSTDLFVQFLLSREMKNPNSCVVCDTSEIEKSRFAIARSVQSDPNCPHLDGAATILEERQHLP